uniref:G-protein coupled receptors family 1 profile domain-containing protein n=1 Tax=Clytia hemisphaerica TaxID=252671 RepID=A0A7M5UT80_9CNID
MDPLLNKVVTIFYFVVFMVIPLLLSTLFHCHIYHFVRRHTKKMSMHVQIKTPPGQLNNNRLDGNTSEASFITKASSVAGDCNTYLVTEKRQLSNMASSVGSTRDENEELCPHSKKSHVVLKIGSKTIRKICHSGTTMCYKVRHRLTGIRHQRKEKTRRIKVHILLAITVSFFVVNAPTNIWHTLNLYFKFSLQTRIYMIFVTGLGSMRCFINGIIYSLMDYKFRKEFRLLVKTLIYGRAYEKKYQQKSHSHPSRSTQMHSVSGNQC